MKTIIIAYDGSECADGIFTELQRAGLPPQLEAHVVSVTTSWAAYAPDPAMWAPFPGMLPVLPSAKEEAAMLADSARKIAAQGAKRLQAAFPGWQVKEAGEVGSAAQVIIRKAGEVSADAIFIGSHSRSAIGRFFLGSVSHKVAAEANCSVRICRPYPPSNIAPRLLVAVDGSTASSAVVNAVLERAWPKGTAAAAVRVIERPFGLGEEFAGEYSDEWLRLRLREGKHERDPALGWLEKVADETCRQLEAAGLASESHTLTGDPKYSLLEWAEQWKADCIFVGASGLQHPGSESLGTVASAVAVRAHC